MNDGDRTGLEVRTYFARARNALVARAEFGPLYVEYHLHQGQLGAQHAPFHDGLFKESLAALTLHMACRPWNETVAWTIHLEDPRLNIFVTGSNGTSSVIGQLFTGNVKSVGRSMFFADVVKGSAPPRRSSVDFEGIKPFRAVERYYAASEQRVARFFTYDIEDFVLVMAQPDADLAWIESLTDENIRKLDSEVDLALLERRFYNWECGCSDERMMAALAPVMMNDPEGLFGGEPSVRLSCPRCGVRFVITRESLEAFVAK